jgi:hypothetical protein
VANLPGYYIITRVMLPSPARSFELDLRTTGQVRAARVGLAAERYRLGHGAFPERIEQLVPEYLSEVPEDPFDGEPLRYVITEEGVVIYSIGEDLVDDGGQVVHDPETHEMRDAGFRLLLPSYRGRAGDDAGRRY